MSNGMNHKKSKMKLFQSIQKSYAILGISQCQPSFNIRILVASLGFGSGIILSNVFLFRDIENWKEFTDTIFVNSSVILVDICFSNMIFKMEKLFQFIDCCEKIFETSKLKIKLRVRHLFENCIKIQF